MPTTIVNYNEEIINFLEDVNYGMSKPQFNHLATIIEGIINIGDNVSISKIAENIVKAKDKSCISRFLSSSPWDDELLNNNRLAYIKELLNNELCSDDIGFLVIDDTVNRKDTRTKSMEALDFHYSHSLGKTCWSHCVITSHFVAGPYSIPLQFKSYYREKRCIELEIPFQSKTDIAKEFIQDFEKPFNLKKIYILMDSWYTSNSLMDEASSENYHLIGGIRSNRNFYPDGNKIKISEFAKNLDPNTLDSVTVKGKEYKVYRYQGKVAQTDNKILLISFEVRKDGFAKPVYILSTDTTLDNKTIIDYYLVRWNIETSYQYFKESLGFDQYRIRSRISIERYFLICFLAYTFLEVFRVSNIKLSLKTIGETIIHHKNTIAKKFISYIYYQARQKVPLKSIYISLKLPA